MKPTQEQVIAWAQEAFGAEHELFWMDCSDENLEAFSALVAAAEREACALTVEQAGIDGYGTLAAAAAIRSRKNS